MRASVAHSAQPMLNERGKLIGDFTMCRIAADDSFWWAPTRGNLLHAWFERHLPPTGVTCALRHAVRRAVRSGPKSRALLQSLVRDDLATAAFPFMSFRAWKWGMVRLRGTGVVHRGFGYDFG